jgi:hypothetical protein
MICRLRQKTNPHKTLIFSGFYTFMTCRKKFFSLFPKIPAWIRNDKGSRAAIDRFASIEDNKLEVLPTAELCEHVKEILHCYDLRAADAIHLASALLC